MNLPMVCTCGDDLYAEGEKLYQRVKDGLGRGSDNLIIREIADRDFFDNLLWSLLIDHQAEVEGIVGDQWFLVSVDWFDADYKNKYRVTCPCDSPTLGLCSIWEWFEAGRPE